MPLVFAAIAPHGFPLIPAISDDADGALATRAAMTELGQRARRAGVEVVVVATPHGIRVDGAVSVADAARAAGRLVWRGRFAEVNLPLDPALTDAVARAAERRGVPVARLGYAGHRQAQNVVPLDWGALVPLWFLGHDRNEPGSGDVLATPPPFDEGPPAVVVTPSRSLPRASLVEFGRAVAWAAEADPRRIAFVASCDWAHTHRADGPFGFHPAATRIDAAVVSAVQANDPGRLIDLDEEEAVATAVDGLWQALMLAGAVAGRRFRSDVLCYEAPTYYGMLTAAFEPDATVSTA